MRKNMAGPIPTVKLGIQLPPLPCQTPDLRGVSPDGCLPLCRMLCSPRGTRDRQARRRSGESSSARRLTPRRRKMRGIWLMMLGFAVAVDELTAQDRTPLYDNLGTYHMA